MEIKLELEEAQKLSSEDFATIIKKLQDYTNKTNNEGFIVVSRNDICKMIINTDIDYQVDDNTFKEGLYTYYYKDFIDKYHLNIKY